MFRVIRRIFSSIVNWEFTKLAVMTDPVFPTTLKDFGYAFDEGGKLRKLDQSTGLTTDGGFEFNVTEDHAYNQKRYEALGQVIDLHIYDLLEKEGLKKLFVPKEASSKAPELKSFIFVSEDALLNDKLMILIHGSGVVRAGQWARRLIINDNLETGTQLPYIRKARELGYAVMVLNTNDNFRTVNGKPTEIPGSKDPHSHVETVWKQYIEPSNAKHVAIVAHSYGGVCVVKLAVDHAEEFRRRVFAVGLTDSVHMITSAKDTKHILKVARNWVSSEKPLDTPERSPDGDIERCSAGHAIHEMTSYSCMESLFQFVEERFNEARGKSDL
ncbi:FAM172 family protein homolog CG10038 isoform X1 [Neodiprion pinetum]|uniref:FAM172 family protein homolog CG10038 isoform X1 n=1 Tax=Neodiprion lecontei TaxID=441921 RepID=A0A6J0BV56_NEOLC|nr:FAM172 family protein homolog CG10038 isoform X1 [Neodiprion lecontei]XP_046483798.1 FAM172 family protein homolog CG10038 isoform X1 [Neodiprion pinetum]